MPHAPIPHPVAPASAPHNKDPHTPYEGPRSPFVALMCTVRQTTLADTFWLRQLYRFQTIWWIIAAIIVSAVGKIRTLSSPWALSALSETGSWGDTRARRQCEGQGGGGAKTLVPERRRLFGSRTQSKLPYLHES